MNKLAVFLLFFTLLGLSFCKKSASKTAPLFIKKTAAETGIDFQNTLVYNDTNNCYTFRNFYNGGGVALGDLNNDGLLDIFFCGNQVGNRLFLNKGNWHFEDATQKAGLESKNVWTTGVALADVNGDGWLDIYLCKSGDPYGLRRANELFINEKNGHFSEKAHEYGLDNTGLSTHAAFFDYDLDGDLDLYLLNNSIRSVGGYDLIKDQRLVPDPTGGNKLFRNDGEKFTDVTQAAGIFSSAIGFGLGVTVGDIDRDGWPDLYVSNDFFERDYLYHNLKNGRFEEILPQTMPEIGMGSMGADMADLTNDGLPEIFVTEMLPHDDARLKTKAQFDNWNKFSLMQKAGYHNQFSRNVLQLNQGEQKFSEIGRLAGVEATDWSWGALLADFDNDGWKDIFVANGIGKDLLDQDYITFFSDPMAMRKVLHDNPNQGIVKLIDKMPSQPLPNYLFKNDGKLGFQNMAAAWGLAEPSFSNGSAYGDLDNDGDLDLVVNNVNQPAFIFENTASQNGANWLKIKLLGEGKNTFAIGAKATVWAGGQQFYQELNPMRGFMSCVDSRLSFGLGAAKTADSIVVEFLGGKVFIQKNVAANQILTIKQSEGVFAEKEKSAIRNPQSAIEKSAIFKAAQLIDFQHVESDFSDFDREPLNFEMLSAEGPRLAAADVNADGLTDFFIGGAAGQASQLFLGKSDGSFFKKTQPDFERDKASEDVAAAFFDADGDGDADLYVGSGSTEFQAGDPRLADRLYLNDGRGGFKKKENALPPSKPFLTAAVRAADFDHDGDDDVFVAMRSFSGSYGEPSGGFLLKNDGQGNFRPAADALETKTNLGMLTDAAWADLNGDGWPELITVGDWETPRVFQNQNGRLVEATDRFFPEKRAGWWKRLVVADLDGDGDLDLVVGNQGLNSRFHASESQPISLLVNDFDQNGTTEPILSQFLSPTSLPNKEGRAEAERSFPMVLRNDLTRQLPFLKKKYLAFDSYKNQTVEQIFTPDQLRGALKLEATCLETGIFLNENGQFHWKSLPMDAQLAPIFAIAVEDFTGDGRPDILLGGNNLCCKPEVGTCAASYGTLLAGDGRGGFSVVPMRESGLVLTGAVRDFLVIKNGKTRRLLVGRNNERLLHFQF